MANWVAPKRVAQNTDRTVKTVYLWIRRGLIVSRKIANGRAVLVLLDEQGLPVDVDLRAKGETSVDRGVLPESVDGESDD